MPRWSESSSRSKRLEKEMHKQLFESRKTGMLKQIWFRYKWSFMFCQEQSKLKHQEFYYLIQSGQTTSIRLPFAQETIRVKDGSHKPMISSTTENVFVGEKIVFRKVVPSLRSVELRKFLRLRVMQEKDSGRLAVKGCSLACVEKAGWSSAESHQLCSRRKNQVVIIGWF